MVLLLWLPRLTAGGPCAFEYTFEQEGPAGGPCTFEYTFEQEGPTDQQEGPTCYSVLLTLTVSWVTIV